MRAKDILQKLEYRVETLKTSIDNINSQVDGLLIERDTIGCTINSLVSVIEEIKADKTPETTE